MILYAYPVDDYMSNQITSPYFGMLEAQFSSVGRTFASDKVVASIAAYHAIQSSNKFVLNTVGRKGKSMLPSLAPERKLRIGVRFSVGGIDAPVRTEGFPDRCVSDFKVISVFRSIIVFKRDDVCIGGLHQKLMHLGVAWKKLQWVCLYLEDDIAGVLR